MTYLIIVRWPEVTEKGDGYVINITINILSIPLKT